MYGIDPHGPLCYCGQRGCVETFIGGVSNVDELYTEGVREGVRFIFSDSPETPIVKQRIGGSAGVIGV